jgi:Arc/MetJ-type ribon-helix-helix transcriptional regulator
LFKPRLLRAIEYRVAPLDHERSRLACLAPLSYAGCMKTLTVRLPDALVLEIERESQSRRVSKSDVVRERLHQPQRAAATGGDMSELIGHMLEESWKAKVPAGPPRFRSPHKRKIAEIIRARHLHR